MSKKDESNGSTSLINLPFKILQVVEVLILIPSVFLCTLAY